MSEIKDNPENFTQLQKIKASDSGDDEVEFFSILKSDKDIIAFLSALKDDDFANELVKIINLWSQSYITLLFIY